MCVRLGRLRSRVRMRSWGWPGRNGFFGARAASSRVLLRSHPTPESSPARQLPSLAPKAHPRHAARFACPRQQQANPHRVARPHRGSQGHHTSRTAILNTRKKLHRARRNAQTKSTHKRMREIRNARRRLATQTTRNQGAPRGKGKGSHCRMALRL